jgi:error-prone DNA polymerase
LPADDPTVYSALQKADTVGMFQIESRAQMSCLPRLRPQHFYDIVVQVAIIRPGPIVGQMVNPFRQRRQGRELVTYAHPSLEPVLSRTLGVPLFQEQLLRMAMAVANFTGGEAEELRRAMGFKRSQTRMKEIEGRLRAGMQKNGLSPEAQEQIVQSITSFALYGFPESHAASFALIAYASAYLKCHYLAAFTAALLNNQPMGFYHPATIVKDSQRHGLRVLPVDVTKSDWNCTLEAVSSFEFREASDMRGHGFVKGDGFGEGHGFGHAAHVCQDEGSSPGDFCGNQSENQPTISGRGTLSLSNRNSKAEAMSFPTPTETAIRNSKLETRNCVLAVRLGLRYARGLREEAAKSLVRERYLAPFASIHDLVRRVPELRKDELSTLAEIGALNSVSSFELQVPSNSLSTNTHSKLETGNSKLSFHRRDALWQVERAVRYSGPLLEEHAEPDSPSPLQRMNYEERIVADYRGTGLTVGPHPMAYQRQRLDQLGIRPAKDLAHIPNGKRVRIAGCVIARQRPGTARGFVFLSLEDETGISNAIITPDLLQANRMLVTRERFLMIEGRLQNQDNVISVKAERVLPLSVTRAETSSHDFH